MFTNAQQHLLHSPYNISLCHKTTTPYMNNPQFIFFGSNQFSVLVLKQLIQNGFIPTLIITVPDAPVGKEHIITPPPIKLVAQELGIAIAQPTSLKKDPSVMEIIASHHPDIGIVAEYGKIIPKEIIDTFPLEILNVHPSLLPKWRGASPIQSALLNVDTETGITIIQLDGYMDHGPVLMQDKTPIGPDEYFRELYERLANMGGDLLSRVIPQWLNKKIVPQPQDETKATVCKKFTVEDGKIDIHQPMRDIYNRIRALSHEPGCWMELPTNNGIPCIIKIKKATLVKNTDSTAQNTKRAICEIHKKLAIADENAILYFDEIQPQGKSVMKSEEFLRGNKNKLILGTL